MMKVQSSSRRIPVRKRDLEISLQGIPTNSNPKVILEQYSIPADLAADILFHACYTYRDIQERSVIDLGTGTGRLALGAMMLGAQSVVGVDVDLESLQIAQASSKRLGINVDWLLSDIASSLHGMFDTVLMNPPFGTKRRHMDLAFLRAALTIGRNIYTIHKSSTISFISRWLKEHNIDFEMLMETSIPIEHRFVFHTRKRYFVKVHVIRIHRP